MSEEAKTVPLTIVAATGQYGRPAIMLGRDPVPVPGEDPGPIGSYWFTVLDRRTLKVVFSQMSATYDTAPDIGSYDTRDYLLIVTTWNLGTGHVPQGALYDFLYDNGGGRELKRVVQLNNTLGCGTWGWVTYVLVGVLGPGRPSIESIEGSSILGETIIVTAELVPMEIEGVVYYFPQRLSD